MESVKGIDKVDFDLSQQLVTVNGHAAPSTIIHAIQETGKDAIIRGTGEPNSAAVCILESFLDQDSKTPVKGLIRIVSVAKERCLFDITLNGLDPGNYYVSLRSNGDLSKGPLSTGKEIVSLGSVQVDKPNDSSNELLKQLSGSSGQGFISREVGISNMIGRSITVSKFQNEVTNSSLVGIIARSAGVWENLKSVCSCSGKTVWQERDDARSKNIN